MTKKILLLVLALPLIMMVTIFTTTKQVSLAVNVPVTGIEIDGSKIIYLDLDQEEQYKVNYTVYPTNAFNQEVTFEATKYGEERLAKLEFNDGYIIPKGVGSAKVTITTNDGGFTDSFIVHVDSNILQSIESTITKTSLFVGETATISPLDNSETIPLVKTVFPAPKSPSSKTMSPLDNVLENCFANSNVSFSLLEINSCIIIYTT